MDAHVVFSPEKNERRRVRQGGLPDTTQRPKNRNVHGHETQAQNVRLAPTARSVYDTIDVALAGIDFTPKSSDPCVYTHESDDTFAILTFYVGRHPDQWKPSLDLGVVKRLKGSNGPLRHDGHGRS